MFLTLKHATSPEERQAGKRSVAYSVSNIHFALQFPEGNHNDPDFGVGSRKWPPLSYDMRRVGGLHYHYFGQS